MLPEAKNIFAFIVVISSLWGAGVGHAQTSGHKVIPPPPVDYVYDEPSVLSGAAHKEVFQALSNEDRQTGNQVLVAIFKSLDSEDLTDYTNRLYQSWKIGEKQKSNGVLMSIFMKERKVRIEVGYGLEGELTDAKSNQIIGNILAPAFKQKSYDDGVKSAVSAILTTIHAGAQTAAEGTQQTQPARNSQPRIPFGLILFLLFFLPMFLRRSRGTTIGRQGFGTGLLGGLLLGRSSDGFFGGGGGGNDGGGGGDFGGGGGSSGGGGASGDW
ncbi:MAG: TPM domain-containing protein [Bdellovibrionales bacterium]|nr:TPM domain-containing protein [Oligoflexia bacterium]